MDINHGANYASAIVLEAEERDAMVVTDPPESTEGHPSVEAELLIEEARRRQRRRRWVIAASIVVGGAVAAAVWLLGGSDPPGTPAKSGGSGAAFQPPWHFEGDRLVIDVTFLSGGRAEVVLPKGSLDPHRLSFVPGGEVAWPGSSVSDPLGRNVQVSRGTVAAAFAGHRRLGEYHDASGRPVPYYGPFDGGVNYLGFQFGEWVVRAWDYPERDPRGPAMTEQQRTFWAAHLDGHVTPDGFLVLDPVPPLANSTTDTTDGRLTDGTNTIGILFRACQPGERQGQKTTQGYIMNTPHGSPWLCDPQVPLIIWMDGDPHFVQAASSIEIRNLQGTLPTLRW